MAIARLLFAALCLLPAAYCLEEIPAAVVTDGGSKIHGLLSVRPALVFKSAEGRKPLPLADVKSLTIGTRVDPNAENEAMVAVGDLQSDQFTVREKAVKTIRALGKNSFRALKRAQNSPDAEVSSRARAMLAEMFGPNAEDSTQDRIVFADGKKASGELNASDFILRTHWGVFQFSAQKLASIQILQANDVNIAALVKPETAPVTVQSTDTTETPSTERWDPLNDQESNPADAMRRARTLTMGKIPDPKGARNAPLATKAGDVLDDAYAPWGVALRGDGGEKVTASETQLTGLSQGLSASVKSDLEIGFTLRGFNNKLLQERSAGVHSIGAVVHAGAPGQIGIAAYDRMGRQLMQIFNRSDSLRAGGVRIDEFLGVKSSVPIARVRFFRAGEALKSDLVIDDICIDRVAPADRVESQSCVWSSSGEHVVGKLVEAPEGSIAIAPEFADNAPPLQFKLEEIERFEPAHEEKQADKKLLAIPHGVLLQSGETFHALLMAMNENEALFVLAGNVELKIPRKAIRKVELLPEPLQPGELPAPISVAAGEKPGVQLKTKAAGNPAAPQPEPKNNPDKKDEKKEEEEEKVEVVGLDLKTREITIRDDGGDWTIGLPSVKSFVLPADESVKKTGVRIREWIFTLREGSTFESSIQSIGPKGIKAEIAGGTVVLPLDTIDALERIRR